MMTVRDLVEKEIVGIKKNVLGRTDVLSPYGKAYWEGNTDALKWVIQKIEEVRTSASTVRNQDE